MKLMMYYRISYKGETKLTETKFSSINLAFKSLFGHSLMNSDLNNPKIVSVEKFSTKTEIKKSESNTVKKGLALLQKKREAQKRLNTVNIQIATLTDQKIQLENILLTDVKF